MKKNGVLIADAYKYSHPPFYEPGTNKIYSYLEARGSKLSQETVFVLLQYYLKEYLEGVVFATKDIDFAERFMKGVFGRDDVFDRSLFDYIVEKHGGKLPLRIKAVREGSVIPLHNVLMTIENLDPNCYWLTNFVETILLQIWYPISVATLSRECKKNIKHYMELSSDNSDNEFLLSILLVDFGMRGVSSIESGAIGAAANLVNFRSSDTVTGSELIMNYYNTDVVYGLSVPATEHSICTQMGEAGELDVIKRIINTYKTGTTAIVSDSYGIKRAVEKYYGTELKLDIQERDGCIVVRPDSGDPVQTLLVIFDILFEKFGYTVNSKGYKVLPSCIRVLQGDGISIDSIKVIYEAITKIGISAENLFLGMGGKLLQSTNRDTFNMAIKASYCEINGVGRNMVKSPVEINEKGEEQKSFKQSKTGRLKLVILDGQYKTVGIDEYPELEDQLITVYEMGEVMKEYEFPELIERAKL